jgi:hypothetical protein
MSLEMAHKVIVPQKKIMSRSFLNSGTLIVIFSLLVLVKSQQVWGGGVWFETLRISTVRPYIDRWKVKKISSLMIISKFLYCVSQSSKEQ